MMVQRLLAVINRGGFEISLFLLVTGYFISRKESRLARFAEMISLAIMAIMTGVSHWIISARMLALRAAMQAPIDQIAANDPRRIAFDALHGYSVTAMGVALLAGLLAFLIMARPKSTSVSEARPVGKKPLRAGSENHIRRTKQWTLSNN